MTRAFLFGFGLGSAATWLIATAAHPIITALVRNAVKPDTHTHAHQFHTQVNVE